MWEERPISRRSFFSGAFCVTLPVHSSFASITPKGLSFARLWRNHPMRDEYRGGDRWPCRKVLDTRCLVNPGDLTHNQCSIRLGIAIQKSFPDLRYEDFPEIRESDDPTSTRRAITCAALLHQECGHTVDELHFIRAVELAASLLEVSSVSARSLHPKFCWLGNPEVYERPVGRRNPFRDKLAGKSGLIFIEHFALGRPSPMQGCHIDLWCGDRLRTKNEIYYRGARDAVDRRYDNEASRVVFWEVNA